MSGFLREQKGQVDHSIEPGVGLVQDDQEGNKRQAIRTQRQNLVCGKCGRTHSKLAKYSCIPTWVIDAVRSFGLGGKHREATHV
jgi:hypothetical protein